MNFAKHELTVSECEEKQRNEFDALQAIYWDCRIIDMRQKHAWQTFKPLEMQISLSPSGGESNADIHVGVDLYVKCSFQYPLVEPYLELRNSVGLSDQLLHELSTILKKQATELAGEVMIHELCSHVRSFLHCHNKAPLESCYAEMMEMIELKEKEKKDEQKKMQDEKENIEKLQAECFKLEFKKKQEEMRKQKQKKLEMLQFRPSLHPKETGPDSDSEALSRVSQNEDDMRISVSDCDADLRLQNDYIIIKKLGHGAFGDVVKVQNLLDRRHYAIKRIPLNVHRNKTKKITQEVKLLSRLNHKNIVRYYTSWIETSSKVKGRKLSNESFQLIKSVKKDTGKGKQLEFFSDSESDSDDSLHGSSVDEEKSHSILFEGSNCQLDITPEDDDGGSSQSDDMLTQFLYIQMEFCDKSTLRDCIDQDLFKDKQLVWLLFGEIVEGLVHIHDQGIVHRDLKPVNIFLDSQNHVKIGDFGLATVASKNLDPSYQDMSSSARESSQNCEEFLTGNVGTALYVSPEVMSGKQPYNQKVDLYSLGIIFFEMCYKPLTTGMERCKVLSLIRQSTVHFPEDFDNFAQSSEKEILLWLLNHDPTKRPSAKELLACNLFPLLPSERNKVEKMLMSVIKNINSLEHKVLMSTIFSQETTDAIEFSYDYMDTKVFNFDATHEMSIIRQQVVNIFEKIFKRHGAVGYDVPTLMPHISNLYPDGSDEVLLMNRSGTVVTLPYDSRVNFVRFITKRNIFNVKRYFIGKIYREFAIPELQPKELWECSFDIISISPSLNLNFDVEVIMVTLEILNELPGFSDKEFQLKINHIDFITAIMNYCQIPADLHHEMFLIFKEYKDINHQKFKLLTKFSSIGLKENDVKKFFLLIQKEDSFTNISSYLKSLPKAKDSESTMIKNGLEYSKNLLDMLQACNSKLKIVFSLRLCNNFHLYSGLSFQISKKCGKKWDVLASGGSYDSLFDIFHQLDSRCDNKRHGVGVSISLEKVVFSVRSCLSLKESRSFVPCTVDLLMSSSQPAKYNMKLHQLSQNLWNFGISCKLFDGHDNTLQSLKNFCKLNNIPYLTVVDNQNLFIKIDSSDKDGLLYKERNFTKFSDFLKKRLWKELSDQSSAHVGRRISEHSDINFNDSDEVMHEVKLIGSKCKYKDSSKVLTNLANVIEKFCNTHIVILVLESPKELIKAIFAHIQLKDEESFWVSMNNVLKEYPKQKKYIQKFSEDLISTRFKNNKDPVLILYSIEDDFYRILI